MQNENRDSQDLFARIPTYIYLFAILALGIFLRFYHLDYKSLWIDELYSIVPTNPVNTDAFIIDYARSDQPPLFFLLLHYWFKLVPYTPFFGRMLCAIFGVAGIVSIFFLGREIKNERVGLFASFLTAINYYEIYYSQELRFYSLLFLMTVLSCLFFIRALQNRTIVSYMLYVLTSVGLLYTQYFGIIVLFVQGCFFLAYVMLYREKFVFVLVWGGLGLLIGFCFLPWMPTLINDSAIATYWIPKPLPYFFAVYYYIYWGKDVLVELLLLIPSSLYARSLWKSYRLNSITKSDIFVALFLGLWIILSYAVPYLRSIFSTPMLIPRYTVITLPAIFMVIALGLNLAKQNYILAGFIVICVFSTTINLFFIQRHYTTVDKAQWREAAQAVIENYEPGVKVYSNMEWWYNFYFYNSDPYIKVLGKYSSDEKAEMQPFIDQVGNERRLWVLGGEGTTGLNGLQQQYIDAHFIVEKRFNYFAARATLYRAK